MMREMEKVFENLKEEFNRKISTDSFISYFVKHSHSNGEGSSSDSFEDISLETSRQQSLESAKHSGDNESMLVGSLDLSEMDDNCNNDLYNISNQKHEISNTTKDIAENKSTQHRVEEVVVLDQFEMETVAKITQDMREGTIPEEHKLELAKTRCKHGLLENLIGIINEYACHHSADMINEDSSHKSLKVINEEDVFEQNRSIIDKNCDKNTEDTSNGKNEDSTIEKTQKREVLSNLTEDLTAEVKKSSEITKTKSREIVKEPKERKQNDIKKQSLHKMMWSEMPEVIDSGILDQLPKKKIQLQEAMFEIIASEASYYRSLMILTSHFFESELFKFNEVKDHLVSHLDKHHIFSNVILIMYTSQNFLNDLDQRWRDEKPLLTQICDIILKHASSDDFQHYVTYLRNQEYQSKALKRLGENEAFRQQLHKLETSSVCGKLSIDSYLMLPMQRLTRLKLLLDALLKLMYSQELQDKDTEEQINTCEMTLEKVKQLLEASDFEKGFMDQKSILMLLMNKMDFPSNFKRIAISDKMFIKEVDVRVHQQNPLKHIRKFSKKRTPLISLILFNDLLIMAKKKGARLLVLDYCDRCNIEVTETQYKSIASSADVSNSVANVDFDDRTDDTRKISLSSLARSKTSMSAEDWKRFNTSLTNSFRSMSLTSRNDEYEIINNSFALKFLKSQTDIFSVPLVLLAKNKVERDEWMYLLSDYSEEDVRLHKTVSLRNNANRKDDFRRTKNLSLYAKKNDDPI